MMTIHYWYTGKQRGGARPNEIEFPSLKLTPSSMRRDQKLRRSSMPPFVNQPTLPSYRRSPEGILPATKWRSPGENMCVIDAVNIACRIMIVIREHALCVRQYNVEDLLDHLPRGVQMIELVKTDKGGRRVPMYSSLREIMPLRYGRYLVVFATVVVLKF